MRWRRQREESELDEEIRFHLETQVEEHMRGGLSREEAEQAARREFGNVGQVREVTRMMWGWSPLERLGQDLRYAVRALIRTPAFTLTAVLSIALGIGANVSSFSLADAFLLRPLPVERPRDVVAINSQTAESPFDNLSYPVFRDLRDRTRSFESLVGYQLSRVAFAPSAEIVPQMKFAMLVTARFFSVLGVEPAVGRGFAGEESAVVGRDAVAVLGHDFWQQQYGGNPAVVGTTVRVNGVPFTVVGVAPERFTGMDPFIRPALYLPVTMAARLSPGRAGMFESRAERSLNIRARLKPGVRMEQAQAELTTLARALANEYPNLERDRELRARGEIEWRVKQSPPSAVMMVLLGVLSLFVLAIACANVAGLLLARARARSREVAIRLAIGAGRARIVQQFLTESFAIAAAGGVAGVGLAFGFIRYLSSIRLPTDTPIVISTELDYRVLLFTALASLGSALVFGLIPAWRSVGADVAPALKAGAVPNEEKSRNRGRSVLVAAQVAMSLVLLVVSATLLDGFRQMALLNPGLRTDHLMMFEFDPSMVAYSPEQSSVFYRQLIDRVRMLAGVRQATLTRAVPFRPNFTEEPLVPEGYEFPRDQTSALVSTSSVDEHYFDTVGTELVAGRAFSASDTAATRRVAIVNQEFARRYWGGAEAVGRRFRMGTGGPMVEVVGVARTGRYLSVAESPTPFVYLPFAQNPKSRMVLMVRTEGPPQGIQDPVLNIVRSLDPNQPVFNVRSFAEYYEQGALGPALIVTQMVGTTGLVGLVLALVGLYGLVAYSVSRRTREIGIRMAIGAGRATVLTLVLRQALVLASSGVAVGLALSVPVFRLLAAALAGVGAVSAWTLVAVPVLLVVVSLGACSAPAWKASRIDPIRALQQD